jgi:hypothetical protein
MADTYSISGRFDGANQIVSSFRSIETQVRSLTNALRDNQVASRSTNQSQSRSANRQLQTAQQQHQSLLHQQTALIHAQTQKYQGYLYAGREAGRIVREQVAYMRELTTETMELAKAQEKFKTIGLSGSENEKAFKAVKDTVKNVRGLNMAEMTMTVLDLHTAFGDLHHAIENLETAGKYSFSFQSLFGDKFSKEQIESQIQAGYKYLEMTGAVAKGQHEVDTRFNALAQVTAGTGGRVTPMDMLVMARRAGPSAQGLSLQGMRNIAALIPELGAEGAGTALMSMYQATVGGVMKQPAAAEFARLGLVDPKKIEYGKAQKLKKILPGGNKLGALLQEDPLEAADLLMKAMAKPLHGPAIDTSNMNKVRQELTILFGNRTAQKLMSLLTTQRSVIMKEAKVIAGAKDIQELYDQALESPMGKMLEFENAVANFKAEIGKPLVEAFTNAAQAAKPFVQLMADYPKISLATMLFAKFGTSVAGASLELYNLYKMHQLLRTIQLANAGTAVATSATQVGAGTATTSSAGILGGIGLAGGTIIAAVVGSLVYAFHIASEDAEAREAAGKAGERLGAALEKRFRAQISGMSEEVRVQMDKATAPDMAADLIKQQRLSEASVGETKDLKGMWERMTGQGVNGFAHYLNVSAQQRDPRGKISYADADQVGNYRENIKSQLATSIASAEQLSEYLSQARTMLESQGRPELAKELEILAAQALPQFADKVAATIAVQEQANQAIGTFTSSLTNAAMQISYLNFANTGNPGSPITPGMGKSIFSEKPKPAIRPGYFGQTQKQQFNLPRRNYAVGGIIDKPTLALMGEGTEPEAVAPLSKLSKLVTAGRGGGIRDVNVPVTIYGDAPVGIESRIASAVKSALAEHLESIYSNLQNDYDLTAI